jgi:Mn2+/Fe2+ NRAMP family transporter
MVVYTISTVAFFLLGAAVLHPADLNPKGDEMISTLVAMYEPVFKTAGKIILLTGAIAVLFSTFFVSSAQKARLMADALGVFGVMKGSDDQRARWVKIFSFAFPLTALLIYIINGEPAKLILISGLFQSILLPMIGLIALYFRWKTIDPRLKPRRWWDVMLVLSVLGFIVIGVYLTITKGAEFWGLLREWLG